MNATMKNSLKSALILIAIAVVAVVSLALANALLPKYVPKLDIEKVTTLNKMLPTGANDQTAFDESYFSMDNEIDLEAFNKANGNSKEFVLAVYRAAEKDGWQYSGSIIIETQTSGYAGSTVVIMTSVKDGVINALQVLKSNESATDIYVDIYAPDNFTKLANSLIGKSAVTAAEIHGIITTGATTSVSAAANSITLSVKMYNHIKGGV